MTIRREISCCVKTSGSREIICSRKILCCLLIAAWTCGMTVFAQPRDKDKDEAQRRILSDSKYVKHIYGSVEVGGTSVFFISDVPFEKLGFAIVPKQPMPVLTANALGDGPTVILVGGALLSGLYWITERRAQVSLAEAREKSAKGRS